MTANVKRRIGWDYDGLYVMDGSIVGTVAKVDNRLWYAHGCMNDWQDVDLGGHATEVLAKRAVREWVRENCDEN